MIFLNLNEDGMWNFWDKVLFEPFLMLEDVATLANELLWSPLTNRVSVRPRDRTLGSVRRRVAGVVVVVVVVVVFVVLLSGCLVVCC